ncbi:MAG: hypothetical protein Q4B03_05150 [Lachnospiraceae bacterium]|nr:hypothetical protein [Lachnospiraceae bacterium]
MLVLRDQLKNLYAEYDRYILAVVKYAMALFTFISVNRMLGYMDLLNSVLVILLLAAVCTILPWNATPVLGIALVILHCFALGLEIGACAVVLYLILLIFYFRFVPDDGLALTLMSALGSIGFPGIVPIGLGLMRSPVSACTAACSTISWFFIRVVHEVAAPLKYTSESSSLEIVQAILAGMLNNRELLVYIITFSAVVLVVSLIGRSGMNWGWQLAIFAGCILQTSLFIVLTAAFSAEADLVSFLLGTIAAAAVSFVLAYFVYNVDYKGAERFQFEDDEFMYYVKAIPKRQSSASERDGNQTAD